MRRCAGSSVGACGRCERRLAGLDNNIRVTGRIDQINRVGQNAVEIVDYKTGKPKTEEAARKDLQLSVYALAAREELGLDPVRLIYYNLQTNQSVTGEREEKQLKEVRSLIQEIAAGIRAREFPALPNFRCKTCEFRSLCPAHEARRSQSTAPATSAMPAQITAPAATLFEK